MIKKITDLVKGQPLKTDVIPFVDSANGETKKALVDDLLKSIIPNNAGAHNGIYRGKDRKGSHFISRWRTSPL